MTTLEQIIAAVQMLPPADRHSLQQWLREQERRDDETTPPAAGSAEQLDNDASPAAAAPLPSAETVEQQLERFRKALRWIDEHRAEYLGQWVVLVGDQLISHGFDGHQVADEAKAAGIEVPFIALVNEEPKAALWVL
jgi:hypothetical protein